MELAEQTCLLRAFAEVPYWTQGLSSFWYVFQPMEMPGQSQNGKGRSPQLFNKTNCWVRSQQCAVGLELSSLRAWPGSLPLPERQQPAAEVLWPKYTERPWLRYQYRRIRQLDSARVPGNKLYARGGLSYYTREQVRLSQRFI